MDAEKSEGEAMAILRITAGEAVLRVQLLDTPTAAAIAAAAPFLATASIWGEEVYFSTPAAAALECDARDVMTPGDIAYWPPGKAIAIGFGPTPASQGDEIRLASPSNVFGRALDDVRGFATAPPGAAVAVSLVED